MRGGKRLDSTLVTADRQLKPPLKWAGGKRWLVKHILPYWKQYEGLDYRFVEPLCGGLAVTLGLMPRKALLNDINPHLINFYIQLKSGLREHIRMKYDKNLYYEYRTKFNELINEVKWNTQEAALLFYYLNHSGYNGLCRFNQKGFFNVPFGEYKQVTYIKDFDAYKLVFQDWRFMCGDFEKVKVEKNDFLYADPPYDVEFRQYSAEGFTWEDQVRLANWVVSLGVPTIISNQATERIVKLYNSRGFKLTFLEGPRMISCKGDRTPAKEVLGIKGV